MADADTCPICGKPSVTGRLHPFCSRRCSDVDLGRWFVGAYRVPTSGSEEELINEAESEN